MLSRRVLGGTSAVAMTVGLLPAAAVGRSRSNRNISEARTVTTHKLSETRKLINIAGTGAVGLVDGRIGARSVHGAFRDVGQFTNSGTEIDRGTEFDGRGSRSFVQHLDLAVNNGRVTVTGTGTWTGGTGAYRHARGSFKLSGGGPIRGVLTSHLKGSISY